MNTFRLLRDPLWAPLDVGTEVEFRDEDGEFMSRWTVTANQHPDDPREPYVMELARVLADEEDP